MIIRGLIDEDFVNYKKSSMVVLFPYCSFKCDMEAGEQVCQNSALATYPLREVSARLLCKRYLQNTITNAIVCSGLEPFDSHDDLMSFISTLRYGYHCSDDIVIYTGYTEDECERKGWLDELSRFDNIIIKFGRYVPNSKSRYDALLGIDLASNNQYAIKLSDRMVD